MLSEKNRKIRVRVPLPDKEVLKRNSIFFSRGHHLPSRTPQDELRFYIRCRLQDIEKQEIEILKAKKRIKRLRQCIPIAEEVIEEFDNQRQEGT